MNLVQWGISLVTGLLLAMDPVPKLLTGTGVAVHSGDTFTLTTDAGPVKVRLEEVDAPELKQTFGREALRFTEQAVLNRTVTVRVSMVDVFGRHVGRVALDDGRLLNEEIVAAGLAWHYRVGPRPDPRLRAIEHDAFAHSLGLWLQKSPLPPWEYRREPVPPAAPLSRDAVDYERIFEYGIVGDPKTKTFQWPLCRGYGRALPATKIFFLCLNEAMDSGFWPRKGCPRP